MLKLIRDHRFYFSLCAVFGIVAAILILSGMDKAAVITVNGWHTPVLDIFFLLYTNEGDGWIFALFIMIMLFVRYKHFLAALSSFLLSTLIVQLGKHVIFPEAKRPFFHIVDPDILHRVPGLTIHIHNSFPSGHTATAFAMFTLLALMTSQKWMHFVFFLLALLVGISRMYLGQHFLSDITAGAFIGIITSLFTHYVFCVKFSFPWSDRSIAKNS